jgi:ornithine cyclodeaminase/alanine dehydrogenase-like protein (mu-crystallin family)
LLDIDDTIAAMTDAHAALARGEVVMPVRLTLRYDDRPSELEAMPAHIGSMPALGMKLIDYVGSNTARGIPAIHALIVVLDPDDGKPLAIMDGTYITAVRTAAASAVATQYLARDDARTLAVVGTGVQANSHIEAMLAIRPFDHVRVAGRTAAKVEPFAAAWRAARPGLRIDACRGVEEAVYGADVVVTATSSPEPILEWPWLAPGAHINAIGSHSPDTRELTTEVVQRARVFVDSREAMLTECGDFLIPIARGELTPAVADDEIGEVVAGLKQGRRSADEVTLYKSGGIAAQDVATGKLVYDRARERGIGLPFTF